jgi:hypothetical protein
MSGKSTGRHALAAMFPEAFVKGRDSLYDGDVVCEDSLQALRCITDKEVRPDPITGECRVSSWRDLAIICKRSAEHYLNKRDCKYYVMCFDNAEYVPITKGEEQGSRDSKEKERLKYTLEGVIPYYELEKPFMELDLPLPIDWSLALSDREGFRKEVIAWLCEQWVMSGDPEVRISIPSGKNLVLNGHCIETSERIFNGSAPEPIDDLAITPIIICGGEGCEIDTVSVAPTLKNKSGEAEFQVFFLFKGICKLEGKSLSLDIISTDTDVMYLALIYAEKYHGACGQISWKFGPRGGWILYRDDPDESIEERVDINRLRKDIISAKFIPTFKPIQKEPQRKRKTVSLNLYSNTHGTLEI